MSWQLENAVTAILLTRVYFLQHHFVSPPVSPTGVPETAEWPN